LVEVEMREHAQITCNNGYLFISGAIVCLNATQLQLLDAFEAGYIKTPVHVKRCNDKAEVISDSAVEALA
jgi:hypothetical protein